MGTRSSVKFYEWENGKKNLLASIYQQYDGYIEGVGYDLARFLIQKKLINGIPGGIDTRDSHYANGPGCLAAQYIAQNKTEIGDLYMTTEDDEQEYNYEVYIDMAQYFNNPENCVPWIEVRVGEKENHLIFEGTPEELLNFKEDED